MSETGSSTLLEQQATAWVSRSLLDELCGSSLADPSYDYLEQLLDPFLGTAQQYDAETQAKIAAARQTMSPEDRKLVTGVANRLFEAGIMDGILRDYIVLSVQPKFGEQQPTLF